MNIIQETGEFIRTPVFYSRIHLIPQLLIAVCPGERKEVRNCYRSCSGRIAKEERIKSPHSPQMEGKRDLVGRCETGNIQYSCCQLGNYTGINWHVPGWKEIIQMRKREKITFVVSALALKYLKIYLCNIKINSCSLNMPLTLTVCFNINPTFISHEDITAPRKKKNRQKAKKTLHKPFPGEQTQGEQGRDNTSKSSLSFLPGGNRSKRQTHRSLRWNPWCAAMPKRTWGDEMLGGLGGVRLPRTGHRGRVGCRRWHLWHCPRTQSPAGIS